ncbi:MAG: hypothetical protein Q8K32_20445 [Archangium sp.]|nr:hypothetical protein [Archangium sp.]
MLQFALVLVLTADARPEPERWAKLLERASQDACAADAGTPALCSRVKAFQAAKVASAAPAIFTLGTFEDSNGERGLQLLELTPEGVTVGEVKPDDEAERQQFLALIEGLRKGRRKDPLLQAVARDAKSMPHFRLSEQDGSLFFQVPQVLGGHWLRRAPGKLLMVSFSGGTHAPQLRFTEFPDDRK